VIFMLIKKALTRSASGPQAGQRSPRSERHLLGAISLLAHRGGGLGWVVAGVIGALVGAVANAWVLLIEILR